MNFKLALLGAATLLLTGDLARADFLPNNFWPNSTFESGVNLDAPDGSGTPTGWVRNGSDPTICQVTSNNYVSPTHSIMVNDQDTANYGEWDCNISLIGLANPGDTINVQYYQMYSIQDGEMRVAVVFLDSINNAISAGQFVVTGNSPDWGGAAAGWSRLRRFRGHQRLPGGGRFVHRARADAGIVARQLLAESKL
jgi:hypothetical protein